jgi:hypothetical protein
MCGAASNLQNQLSVIVAVDRTVIQFVGQHWSA